MNKLEKKIYDVLKHHPRIKLFIRDLYQDLFDLLPKTREVSSSPIIHRQGYFYGFHDHTPFSSNNSKLLANRALISNRMPEKGEELGIGYFSGPSFEDYTELGRTQAWKWHMGCKLQWRGAQEQVVYNDHLKGKNISRLTDINTGETHELPDSIGSVSPDGNWAVGYSFARVEKCMPGYGYDYDIADSEIDLERPKKNGIHRINLNTRQKKLLLSINDIVSISPTANMKDSMHFVTHTVFSPNSKRFIFLHRWIKGDVTKRWSRLIACDINGENICVFPTKDMVSHIGWRTEKEIIAYCRIDVHDDRYVLFTDGDSENYKILGYDHFTSDGHPSFDSSGRWMITDTYPDRRRNQNLVLYDTQNNNRFDIAKLFMPRNFRTPEPYSHWACDLHPRWDRKSEIICFDSASTGTRSLCTMNVSELLK